MPAPRPSLRQIAAALHISAMTVSRALRGRPGVATPLRKRILAEAERLGYRPDPSLRRLMLHLRGARGHRMRAVICALTDIPLRLEPAYCRRLRTHAEARALELGFAFSLLRVGRDPTAWRTLDRVLRSRGVEGVLLLPMVTPLALDAPDWSAFSVLSATSSVTRPAFHRVAPHHALNARRLVATLAEAGHRRIGFVGTRTHAVRTLDAFTSALALHHQSLGLRCVPLLHDSHASPDVAAWARRERPDVVIVGRPADLPAYSARLAAAGLAPAWAVAGHETGSGAVPGIDERHDLVGTAAVDLLAGMIARSERGVPSVAGMTLLPGDCLHPLGSRVQDPETLP